MMEYQEKKLEPKLEMSKRFIEKYMDQSQFDHNNYGDMYLGNVRDDEKPYGDPEEVMKALKRLKAV